MEDKENEAVEKDGDSGLDVFLRKLSSILSIKGLLSICLAVIFSIAVYTSMTTVGPDGNLIPIPESVVTLFSAIIMSFFANNNNTTSK